MKKQIELLESVIATLVTLVPSNTISTQTTTTTVSMSTQTDSLDNTVNSDNSPMNRSSVESNSPVNTQEWSESVSDYIDIDQLFSPTLPPTLPSRSKSPLTLHSSINTPTMSATFITTPTSTLTLSTTTPNTPSLLKSTSNLTISIKHSLIYSPKSLKKDTFGYIITLSTQTTTLWSIEKSYSHFYTLDCKLRRKQPRSVSPTLLRLPDKSLFTSYSPLKSDMRKQSLQDYINSCLTSTRHNSKTFIEFLTTDIYTADINLFGEKEGYLYKRGKNFGAWKPRYFILDSDKIHYYDWKDGTYYGSILLCKANVYREESSVESDDEHRHAMLIVEESKSKHVLCAESDEERNEWVELISLAIVTVVKENASPALSTNSLSNNSLSSNANSRFFKLMGNKKDKHHLLFGLPLSLSVSLSPFPLPTPLHRCILYIEHYGLSEEGLYRLSGSNHSLSQLRLLFDSKGDVDFNSLTPLPDVHVVAGLLKLFLRELPTPLLTSDLQARFVVASDTEDWVVFRELLEELDDVSRRVVVGVGCHLRRVVERESENRMGRRNIGIVFSPTLGVPVGVVMGMIECC